MSAKVFQMITLDFKTGFCSKNNFTLSIVRMASPRNCHVCSTIFSYVARGVCACVREVHHAVHNLTSLCCKVKKKIIIKKLEGDRSSDMRLFSSLLIISREYPLPTWQPDPVFVRLSRERRPYLKGHLPITRDHQLCVCRASHEELTSFVC